MMAEQKLQPDKVGHVRDLSNPFLAPQSKHSGSKSIMRHKKIIKIRYLIFWLSAQLVNAICRND
ncbi:hypothetical protein HZU75_08715 [Chitinibacter fontanus]|uniref:Uncharacterized protein n=1 Tax=Chitinibacter fontanus TaxID=1737446 RepID=A0A7D5ZDD9_9NEIS|nr:hypothetical protein [Chitinibacter fontanus]QLI81606.1 hypothetical protein HZU75_08715 [Chitinibacter fontanus]